MTKYLKKSTSKRKDPFCLMVSTYLQALGPVAFGPVARQNIIEEAHSREGYSSHGGQETNGKENTCQDPNVPFKATSTSVPISFY
jgi:hypothetical protein